MSAHENAVPTQPMKPNKRFAWFALVAILAGGVAGWWLKSHHNLRSLATSTSVSASTSASAPTPPRQLKDLDVKSLTRIGERLNLWIQNALENKEAKSFGLLCESQDGHLISIYVDCRDDRNERDREAVALVRKGASAVYREPECTLLIEAYVKSDRAPAATKARSILAQMGHTETPL